MEIKIIDTIQGLQSFQNIWQNFTNENFHDIYNSPIWQTSALKSFVKNDSFKFYLFYESQKLVGVLPLYLDQTKFVKVPVKKLRYFEPYINLSSLTILEPYSTSCLENLVLNNSKYLPNFHILRLTVNQEQLHNIRNVFKTLQVHKFQLLFSERKVLCLKTNSKEEFWQKVLSSHRRKDFRRIQKRMSENYYMEINYPQEAQINANFNYYWNRLKQIYQNSWKHLSHRAISRIKIQEKFYKYLFQNFADQNQLFISFLQLDNQDVASIWWIKFNDVIYGIQTAYLSEFKKYSPGTFLLQHNLLRFLDNGENYFDFMGSQKYKEHYTNVCKPYYDIYIFNKKLYSNLIFKLAPFSSIDLKPIDKIV